MNTATFLPKEQIGVGGFKIGKAERRYLSEVIDSSRLSYGPMTERLEAKFAAAHDSKYAVFCNSGTSALHMALAVLKERGGWEDGDEVIVPALTFVATSNIVLHNNMRPVFADVEPDTYNLDPEKIEELLTPRTRAILPVHLFGQPASMQPIQEIASKRGLAILEDSAETMFARYQGQSVGAMGDIGCFSTYVAHLLVTGVGGFAVTNDDELAVMLKSSMNHGRDAIYLNIDDDKGKTSDQLFNIVERRFKFVRLGHSFRCTELEAAIGLGQIEQADAFLARRREVAQRYTAGLSDLEDRIQLPHPRPDRTHSYMMYPIVLRQEPKWDLVRFLEDRQIETREMMPLVTQPVYRRLFGDIEAQFSVARWVNESGFYVGCHPYLLDEEVDYIIARIHEYFIGR
jgi:dTDP-4-amino-4,6-dideoxygalactose transaminase